MASRSVTFSEALRRAPDQLLTGLPLLDRRFGLGYLAGVRWVRVESPALDGVARALFDRVRPRRNGGSLGAEWYTLPSLSLDIAYSHAVRSQEMGDVVFLVTSRILEDVGSVAHLMDVIIDVAGAPDRARVIFRKNRHGNAGYVSVSFIDGQLTELAEYE